MKDFFMHEGGKTMYIVFLIVLLVPFIVMIVMNALEKKALEESLTFIRSTSASDKRQPP